MTDDITHELAETLKELRTKFDTKQHLGPSMVRVDAILDRYAEPFMSPEKPKMTINLKDYENKLVVVTLRNEWRIVSLVHKNRGDDDYKCFPYSIDGKNYSNDGRVLITAESPYDIIDIKLVDEDPEPVITRVEVITDKREYVNWNPDNKITTSLQDDGRTLKVFVNKVKEDIDIIKECRQTGRTRYTTKKLLDKIFGEQMTEIEEPEMPITKPEFYDNLPPGDKTRYNVAEKEVSKQWANALSVLIEELSPHSSLSLWGYEGKTPTPEKVVECLRGLIKHREQSATDAVEEVSKPTFHIEPEVIEDLWNTAANYKKFANDIAELMTCITNVKVSNYWAKALSGLIDELGGDSPALWEWNGITPTPEKVVECLRENIQYLQQLASDDELEACLGLIAKRYSGCNYEGIDTAKEISTWMRNTRRPQPITLKSQALRDFETVRKHSDLLPEILDTIENALKSIPE